ncbi:mitochondrial import receptor subunit TOM7 homolog isoform X1 [Grus americana]|uniref:mitochondrial import receptor subunit TOM7 homolog isoform X1 n=1 Tax=Grus americana TaxID=9117 RepID=UPI0024085D13|nr:mitochondrial import receptor subunit TOM7 homolog isoform X1 [Grus americana]
MGSRPTPLAQRYEGGWAPPPPPLCPAAGMPKLSKEAKQRLQQLFKGGQFAIRWGFIPVVLYLVYFGDEGCGGPVLEPADGQRKCLKIRTFQRMRRTLTPAGSISLLMT